MHIDDQTYQRDGKTYRRVLVRKSYKENDKYKKKTVLNLSDWDEEYIQAFKIALNHSDNISRIQQLAKGKSKKGKSFALPYVLNTISRRIGIKQALGNSKKGKLAQWMVMARLINQGSRLSAVRLANQYAVEPVLDLPLFNEDNLYSTLDWIYDRKSDIEKQLLSFWNNKFDSDGDIYLYDVTSSYFEGIKNEYADWGYNRDKKKGKQQVVYGALANSDGEPFGIDAFPGNTSDTKTFKTQIDKMKAQFGCDHVTFVGDKGMIKKPQIKQLSQASDDYNYITSISKREIKTFLKKGDFQLSLFTEEVAEVYDSKQQIRYILRRNPYRAKEMRRTRKNKIKSIRSALQKSNDYLKEHSRAKPSIQLRDLKAIVKKLKLKPVINIHQDQDNSRKLELSINKEALKKKSELDGCYAIKTDVPQERKDKQEIHNVYKSLSQVEWFFRTSKDFLGARPIWVRTKEHTVAHLLIIMMAYKLERYLRNHWRDLNNTVAEGIELLKQYSGNIIELGKERLLTIPQPNKNDKAFFENLNIELPQTVPYKEIKFATRKKLNSD